MTGVAVLLVDDEKEFASTVAERLQLRGFDVRTANDGLSALESIADNPPDVVILDVKMPGLSGMEVLNRIRRDHPGIPVVLLTGFGSEEDGEEGVRQGAFEFLMKPIEIEVLIEKINQATRDNR